MEPTKTFHSGNLNLISWKPSKGLTTCFHCQLIREEDEKKNEFAKKVLISKQYKQNITTLKIVLESRPPFPIQNCSNNCFFEI